MKPNRHQIAFLSLLAVGLCASVMASINRGQSQTSSTGNKAGELVIHFERSGCYGNCPVYKLTIYSDGRIEYEGENFVKQKGKAEGHIASADLATLVMEFDKAGFWTMDQFTAEGCKCGVCTDMPMAITEIKNQQRSHRVEHYYGCRCAPKTLWDLEQTIDKLAHTEQWTGDVSKQGPFGTTCSGE